MARRLRKRKKKACCRRSYPKCRRIRSDRGLPRFVYSGRGGSLNRPGRLGSIAAAIVPHGTRKDHFLPRLFLLRIYHRSHLRSVLFRCDAPVLEHQRILGDTLLQNRRKGIRQTGVAVLHPVARRPRIFLSGASFGSALDGTEKVTIAAGQENGGFPIAGAVFRPPAVPKAATLERVRTPGAAAKQEQRSLWVSREVLWECDASSHRFQSLNLPTAVVWLAVFTTPWMGPKLPRSSHAKISCPPEQL